MGMAKLHLAVAQTAHLFIADTGQCLTCRRVLINEQTPLEHRDEMISDDCQCATVDLIEKRG